MKKYSVKVDYVYDDDSDWLDSVSVEEYEVEAETAQEAYEKMYEKIYREKQERKVEYEEAYVWEVLEEDEIK